MKLYKKIIGILTLLISLVGFGILIFILIDGSDSDRVPALLLFIPAYIILHFAVMTRFGFENTSEKSSKITLIGTTAILVLILIFPFRYGIEYYQSRKVEKELNVLKDWGNDENLTTGIQGLLRTKFESKEILYQLELKGNKESYSNLDAVTIQLEDKDRFIVDEIKIPFDGSANISSYSYENNDSLSLTVKGSSYLNSEDYQKISHWELLAKQK